MTDWSTVGAAELQSEILRVYREIGTTTLRLTVEVIAHPDHVAELRSQLPKGSPAGPGIRVTADPDMPRGTLAERLSDGSWRFTPIGGDP